MASFFVATAATVTAFAARVAPVALVAFVGFVGFVAGPLLAAEPVPEPVILRNDADLAISCHAEIAHWFAADLGEAAPGAEVVIDLWRDPATGEITTRNAKAEFLPVERAWCGIAGRAYQTRWQIPLARVVGTQGAGGGVAATDGGAGRDGSVRDGSVRDGAVQNDSGQNGAVQNDSGQNWAVQNDSGQNGARMTLPGTAPGAGQRFSCLVQEGRLACR